MLFMYFFLLFSINFLLKKAFLYGIFLENAKICCFLAKIKYFIFLQNGQNMKKKYFLGKKIFWRPLVISHHKRGRN